MIIYNLHIERTAPLPAEANAPLIVNSNTVLSLTGTPQLLKPVARWRKQIAQILRIVQIEQLAPCCFLDFMR